MGRFSGRRALVTGASRGIGAAVAEELAKQGAAVAITARTLDQHPTLPGSLNDVADRLRSYGNPVGVVVADLSDEEARSTIVDDAVDQLGGRVDILVNNAAVAIYQPVDGYSLKRRRLTFEVNVHAPIDLVHAVLPAMRERGEGWIVYVSSGGANFTQGPPFTGPGTSSEVGVYGATKAAANRIHVALAGELYGTGIRVNTIEPRAAVLSEGAAVLWGDRLTPDQLEPMSAMVAATLYLCDCAPDHTGFIDVSLDLIAAHGLQV